MIYNKEINKAIKLAYEKHQGQFDKNGLPYVFHPWHLAEQMIDEDSIIVALLHDILEDTDTSVTDLVAMGFKKEVIDTLVILNRHEDTDYFEYIKMIAQNELAKKVKLADLYHNADLTRLDNVSEKDLIRSKKYQESIDYLNTH